jgi:hypothetical protein
MSIHKFVESFSQKRLLVFVFLLSLILTPVTAEKVNSANNGTINFETTYYSPIDIQVSVVNMDVPNSPITEGTKIKLTINCKIRGTSLPKTMTIRVNYGNQSVPIDSRWEISCGGILSQKDKTGKTYQWDDLEGKGAAFSYSSDIFETRSEAIYTLVSSEPVYIRLSAEASNKDYDGFNQKGSMDIQQLFIPSILSTSKNKNSGVILNDDGLESDDETNMSISVIREKSGSYLINLLEFNEGEEVKLIASRKGSKTYTFINEIGQSGNLKIRTKRNLKGYKIQVLINDDVVLLSTVK